MRNKIHKILGVGITLVIAMALVMGFAAPAAASPGETINEWYNFTYPGPGADDGWFYDPSITRLGEITEAIDGTLYVHVQRCIDDLAFDNSDGTMVITEFGTSDTGMIVAEIDGDWVVDLNHNGYADPDEPAGPETDFVAFLSWDNTAGAGTMCIMGTITATHLSFKGSIEALGGDLVDWTHVVTGGGFTVEDCGFSVTGPYGDFGGWDVEVGYDIYFDGFTNLGSSVFKSTDGGRTWEDTGFPGGWVVDMAASSLDADILYVADGLYVYKTSDAGDTWVYVKKDSLEEQLSGACHVPACCYCGFIDCNICPSCSPPNYYPFTCPITSIDVTYDDNDSPYIFIGTRAHCSGIDLDEDTWFDEFPGEVYWICEAGFPSNWSGLGLDCYRNGTYDALAVGCAPDWADTNETYVVVTTDDDNGDGFPDDPGDLQTHVVSTTGGPCDWPEYAELKWDCVTPFASAYASRIAFPDDWEDTGTLFVGVTDCAYCIDCDDSFTPNTYGCGGDVYMVMDGSALDMNVKGISTGCIGLEAVDIISLDIEGDTEEARLIAGDFCCNKVYCSEDGGWSWDASAKDPTGAYLTYAIWYEDTALAVTSGCECAVSMCCGEDYPCEFWNQISLISTGIDCVRYIDHSPGYVCGDSETMFMLTNWDWDEYWDDGDVCCFPCQMCDPEFDGPGPTCYDETQSVWRHDGTYWERVYSNTIAGANVCCKEDPGDPEGCTEAEDIFWRLQVSPDFNTTNAVYLWNGCFEMWRTQDAGCSWTKLTFPCTPRPCIREAVVIDEDTVIAGGMCCHPCCDGAAGYVYKTTRHGARPWDEYEFDATHTGDVVSFALEPGYEDPGSVLLGDDMSRVYISEDGGETWDQVGKALFNPTAHPTWVVFDPAYATNHIIYAAAQNVIVRCIIDPDADWADQVWEVICDHGGYAEGIQAVGDTVLYVADGGKVARTGVFRSLNPDADEATDVIFEELSEGLDGTPLWNLWLTCDTSDEGCAENVLWALEPRWGDCQNIWVWEDTLAAPVVLDMPLDGQKLTTTRSATLSWNALCGADCYEVALWRYCPECPDEKMVVPLYLDCAPGEECIACASEAVVDECACPAGGCPCTSDICIVVGPGEYYYYEEDTDGYGYRGYWEGLEPGTTYYWQVRVCLCQPYLSKWSEERTFMTALVDVPGLCSPECGGQDIILTPNFSWDAVPEATGYDIELATTETFTAGVVKGSSTVNAWVAPEPLEYAKTYYWRVRAEKDGLFSDWSVCIFTTMEKPVAPTPPVTITPAPPAPQVNIPPAEMITPNWIYAIIGIGAALVVVVIVLIVRTRRTPA